MAWWAVCPLERSRRRRILFDWNGQARPTDLKPPSTSSSRSRRRRARRGGAAPRRADHDLRRARSALEPARPTPAGLGVSRGARWGFCFERSFDVIVALLGILKAGAAYLPLEQSYPQDRLDLHAGGCRSLPHRHPIEPGERPFGSPGSEVPSRREQDAPPASGPGSGEEPAASDSMCLRHLHFGLDGEAERSALPPPGREQAGCAWTMRGPGPRHADAQR